MRRKVAPRRTLATCRPFVPVMDFHKQEQEAAMMRDIRIANKSEVDEYVDETNKNFTANVKITRSS